MPSRLEALEKMVAAGVDNPMAWYGLAMEYRGAKRFDEALQAFERTREKYPTYVAQYLMAAQMLHELARDPEARRWCEDGIAAARAARDGHSLGELEGLMASLS